MGPNKKEVMKILIHVDIFVEDMDKMLDFYVGKLGLEVFTDDVVHGGAPHFMSYGRYDSYRIVLLKTMGTSTMLELVQFTGVREKREKETQRLVTLTFWTPSLDEKIKNLGEKGLFPASKVFHVDVKRVGKSKIVFFEDPEKNPVEFLEMYK